MSEQLNISPEQPEALLEAPEHHEVLPAHTESLQRAQQAEARQHVEAQEARRILEQTVEQPNPLAQLEAIENTPQTPEALPINQELKRITLQRELRQLRRQLPAPDRLLSRAIHQPVVRRASEIAGESLTRPSGLLGGGLAAFLGTSAYLYLAKHIGFMYNYGVFLLLLVAGFAFGVLVETLVWLVAGRNRHLDR